MNDANPHPLLAFSEMMQADLPLHNPMPHPLEFHQRLIRDFGRHDGTVKVYNVAKEPERGYREQGETAEEFRLHHDGLGAAGAVDVVALYTESPPLWGGFTYFMNVCHLAIELAVTDLEAFISLFHPLILCVTRPRGKGAIRVTCPVLYLNEAGEPQSACRFPSGEYIVEWADIPAVARARAFLESRLLPFAPGCYFVNFSVAGQGCFVRNREVAHGRTRFLDGLGRRRVLARKWFMRQEQDAVYKHVPSVRVNAEMAGRYPDLFSPSVLSGEWILNQQTGENKRVR